MPHWVTSAQNKVDRIKASIIYYEKCAEAAREKLKIAEEALAKRQEQFKGKKDYEGKPFF